MSLTNISNNCTIKAIDVSGSMSGLPILLASCLCIENGDDQWIPFYFDNEPNVTEIKYFPVIGETHMDRIKSIISVTNGYNLSTCIELACNT